MQDAVIWLTMSPIMPRSIDNVNDRVKPGRAAASVEHTPPEDVLDLVHTLMHRVRSLRQRGLRGLPYELTTMDMRVLGFVGRQPGATQSALAQRSGRDKAQLARLVKGLRERGLLELRTDAADRRNQQLFLSESGLALHQALRQQIGHLEKQAVAGLSAAERSQLRTLLQHVDANLRRLAEDDTPET